ncbi:PAS domain-containing protein [Paracoccus benzoatiresistens]|uniref:PAS domain-containing protein n=1 Tax=Paracoccus benzoatiresistens TaxID=2997341 RepID=A0ABT4J1S7_9RHOB|nr:PAS domain-containing protein [Paracoccus sp. EF6]MCZ0961064.1 PAS domain-containing protein [Paracoccus sp. EF6]
MARRIREHDWAATPLGPVAGWPQSLRTAVDILLGSGHAMQLAWGPEQTILYNDAYAPMLGGRHPGALGLPFREVWTDIWTEIEPFVERVFAGETVRFEMPLVMTRHGYPEETWWDFSCSPVRDELGTVAGLLNVTVDATGKVRGKRAQIALHASETRLRNVLNGMDEAFGLMDRDFRILTFNDAALRLGTSRLEDILGRTHWEVYPGSENSEIGRLLKRAMEERRPVSFEHLYTWENGQARWLETRAYPVPEGLAVFWRDISERKAAEERLRVSEAKYRRLFEAIDEGFVIAELIHDAGGRPVDALYVEGNPAASRLTGVADYAGRRRSEIMPGAEPEWLEIYDRVARTGMAERLERYAVNLGQWYDFQVIPMTDAGAGQGGGGTKNSPPRVAILFSEHHHPARGRGGAARQRGAASLPAEADRCHAAADRPGCDADHGDEAAGRTSGRDARELLRAGGRRRQLSPGGAVRA